MYKNLENKVNEESKKDLLKLKVAIGLSALFIGYATYSDEINETYCSIRDYISKKIPSASPIVLEFKGDKYNSERE